MGTVVPKLHRNQIQLSNKDLSPPWKTVTGLKTQYNIEIEDQRALGVDPTS